MLSVIHICHKQIEHHLLTQRPKRSICYIDVLRLQSLLGNLYVIERLSPTMEGTFVVSKNFKLNVQLQLFIFYMDSYTRHL